MPNRRIRYEIEPMDLANMRAHGVRSLRVCCHKCLHEVIMNVDHLPGDVIVPSFGPRCARTAGRSARTFGRRKRNERPVPSLSF
jgi:hypothetical protein